MIRCGLRLRLSSTYLCPFTGDSETSLHQVTFSADNCRAAHAMFTHVLQCWMHVRCTVGFQMYCSAEYIGAAALIVLVLQCWASLLQLACTAVQNYRGVTDNDHQQLHLQVILHLQHATGEHAARLTHDLRLAPACSNKVKMKQSVDTGAVVQTTMRERCASCSSRRCRTPPWSLQCTWTIQSSRPTGAGA